MSKLEKATRRELRRTLGGEQALQYLERLSQHVKALDMATGAAVKQLQDQIDAIKLQPKIVDPNWTNASPLNRDAGQTGQALVTSGWGTNTVAE